MSDMFTTSDGTRIMLAKTISLNCDRSWASIIQENHLLGYAEKSLLHAVLKQSLCDLFCCHTPPVPREEIVSRLCRQAQDWFFSVSEEPFSFIWICRYFGIDGQWLKSRLYWALWQQSIPLDGLETMLRELGKSNFAMTDRRSAKLKTILSRESRVSAISVGRNVYQKDRQFISSVDETASIADIAYAV